MITFTIALSSLVLSTMLAIKTSNSEPVVYGKNAYDSSDINQLVKDSQLVVLAEVNKDKKSIIFHDFEYTISSVKVIDSLKGSIHNVLEPVLN